MTRILAYEVPSATGRYCLVEWVAHHSQTVMIIHELFPALQGKTLAFVLPILESLTNGRHKASRNTDHGWPPSVLVLLPTRELANQVHADFEIYGRAVGLSACYLYGGSSFNAQANALRKGVDIVVGTPGRIKDHLERGTLDLKLLKFRVLDEADEMLNMGFVDDVELILGKVQDVKKVQTLLFSATMPEWVKKISSRFLKPEKRTADLVGNEKLKASATVRHLLLPCSRAARAQLIPDVIRCYSRGGRTIIFTETKESASELAGLLPGARALHGDIMQSQREVILAGLRSGRFSVLVATNVAARGLDINDVQLIIQGELGGPGKTLAFVLPILESLTNGRHKASRNTGHGWPPSVLVLLPTRELANQVHADFEIYGRAVGLSACCLYGGSSFNAQANALRKGVDIVVGTPGRIKDHLERGTLDLKLLKFCVLDEADEMLNMGFVDDVELILAPNHEASSDARQLHLNPIDRHAFEPS